MNRSVESEGLVWLMPNFQANSEGWMQALLLSLGARVWKIGSCYCDAPLWNEQIPVLDLQRESLLSRAARGVTRRPRGDFPGIHSIKNAINDRSCGAVVIHYADFAVNLLPLLDPIKKPVFVFCHGIDVTFDMRNSDAMGSLYHPPGYLEDMVKLAEKVIYLANSDHTAKILQDAGVPSDRVRRFHFGVEAQAVEKVKTSSVGKLVILYLGRLVDFKGPDFTIRAFAEIVREVPDCELWIAGDGPMAPVCRLLVEKFGIQEQVVFFGSVPPSRAAELMKEADIFTLHNCQGRISHQIEAFGCAILEAMSIGLPVVCGRSGGVPEFVKDGKNGLLVEPGNVSHHAKALLSLARSPDLRFQYGQAGKRTVEQSFTVERMRQSILQATAY